MKQYQHGVGVLSRAGRGVQGWNCGARDLQGFHLGPAVPKHGQVLSVQSWGAAHHITIRHVPAMSHVTVIKLQHIALCSLHKEITFYVRIHFSLTSCFVSFFRALPQPPELMDHCNRPSLWGCGLWQPCSSLAQPTLQHILELQINFPTIWTPVYIPPYGGLPPSKCIKLGMGMGMDGNI